MLDQIQLFVNNNLMASASVIAMVVEVSLRMVPSEKPMSILLSVSKVVHGVAGIAVAIDSFLNKIIPQKLK